MSPRKSRLANRAVCLLMLALCAIFSIWSVLDRDWLAYVALVVGFALWLVIYLLQLGFFTAIEFEDEDEEKEDA